MRDHFNARSIDNVEPFGAISGFGSHPDQSLVVIDGIKAFELVGQGFHVGNALTFDLGFAFNTV